MSKQEVVVVIVGIEGCGWLGKVFRRSASWQDRPGHPSNAPWLELKRVAFSLVLWSNHSPHVLKPPSVPSLSFLWQSPTLPTLWWMVPTLYELVSLSSGSPPSNPSCILSLN